MSLAASRLTRLEALSPREREVCALVVCGATNRDIGRELGISTDTANRHVDAIMAKLGVNNRVSIATLYYGGIPYPSARRSEETGVGPTRPSWSEAVAAQAMSR